MTKDEKATCFDVLASIPTSQEFADTAHAITCGVLHSNIPPCCVAWHICGWSGLTSDQQQAYEETLILFFPGGYMPCPECFAKYLKTGSFRRVKDCNCECQCCGCVRERSPEGLCRHGKTAAEDES